MYRNSNVLVAGGTTTYVSGDFVQGRRQGFRQLKEHVVAGALHNSGEVSDLPKCHPGTRVAILQHFWTWASALAYVYPITWLHGPAGSGKSSILRTIAQILFDKGLLIASFFFFRSSSGRSSSEHFITTIAYQLALSIPPTRPHIEEAIENNPLIFSLSLWDQAQALILSPILAVHHNNPDSPDGFDRFPRVIIVDGLDECRDPEKQGEILRVLRCVLESVPIPLAVLIASRPEHHIRDAFLDRGLNKFTSRLSLDNSYNPDADIKQYLVENFRKIEQRHRAYLPTSPWPPLAVVDNLVAKASGQFIYVSTIIKFLNSPRHNPAKRLDVILGSINAGHLRPFEQLDMLYSTIFHDIDEGDLADVLRVLGVLLVPCELPRTARTPAFLQRLLNLDTGDIRHLLFDLGSLLTLGSDDEPIRFFHASLGDYLFDSSRSGQFWIDSGKVYADLAQHCIIHLPDSKKWIDLKRFFWTNSFLFFSKASPTLELRDAIESCDLRRIIDFSLWAPASGLLVTDISPTLLLAIRNTAFSDANELYLEKLATYAKIIWIRIHIYFQDIRLARFIIAATSMEVADEDFKGKREHYQYLRSLLQVSDEIWDAQKRNGLCLEYSSLALIRTVREILGNGYNSNAGYYIDENQYADAALYLLEYMTHHPSPSFEDTDRTGCNFWAEYTIIERTINKIFPVLLSKSSIQQDILTLVKNPPLHQYYLEFSLINDALQAYILRSEALVTSADSCHSKSLPAAQDSDEKIAETDTYIQTSRNPWFLRWNLFHMIRGSRATHVASEGGVRARIRKRINDITSNFFGRSAYLPIA